MPYESIVQPYRSPGDPEAPEAVALVPAPFAYYRAARRMKGRDGSAGESRLDFFHLCRPSGADESWALAGPALGAPASVLALEKLVVLGARRILLVGPCGSIAPEAPIGTVIVPTEAVSEEGTSRLYGAEPTEPIPVPDAPRRGLEAALEGIGISHARGSVWTTDAPYRETRTKVEGHRADGVIVVEMELAACLAAGAFRGVAVAGLLVVSDELFGPEWLKGFDDKRFIAAFQRLVDALPALLRSLEE